MAEPRLVRWMEAGGKHQTGYLLMVGDRALYRLHDYDLESIVARKPDDAVGVPGTVVLVVPHHQPPHAIVPVWVPLTEIHRWPMRSEWEHDDGREAGCFEEAKR